MSRGYPWTLAGSGLAATLAVLTPTPRTAVAAEYLTLPAAQKLVFPRADQFTEMVLRLTDAQRARAEALAGIEPPHRSLRIWRASQRGTLLGYVFVDEVLGREQFITYAIGIDPAGKLGELEVLAYRESHGGEIRDTAWRRQFAGRTGLEALRVRTDIKNIAGATLSCEHVTEGVRWIDALWQVVLRPGVSKAIR